MVTEQDDRFTTVAEDYGCGTGLGAVIIKWSRFFEIPISLGFALIEHASRFQKIFGYGSTIFVGAGVVTKTQYLQYKSVRGPRGEGGEQGVGEAQLTSYTLQDAADKLGGCWRADCNVQVAFRAVSELIRKYGLDRGLAVYRAGEVDWRNGRQYSFEVQALMTKWYERLT